MKKILLIFLLVVISCGTRKVTKTSVDIAIEEKSITKDSISKQSIEISEIKDTERDSTWPWWWVLIIIGCAGILYADYKRY